MLRLLFGALLAALALSIGPAPALGHAVLLDSSPDAGAILPAGAEQVVLGFNEPIQIVDPQADADVVTSDGTPVQSGTALVAADAPDTLEIPLRDDLPPDTYTVRYRIVGADSHVIPGAFVFGVGVDELSEPYLVDAASTGGPSATGPIGVSARFLEIATVAGLLGIVAFRWLVWRPSLARLDEPGVSRSRLAGWGRDGYWAAFGALALASMLALAWSLVVQTATVLGTSVSTAIGDTAGVSLVLSDTRFGELVQLRAGVLFGAFALAAWQFLAEHPREREVAPGGLPAYLRAGAVAALLVVALGVLGAQGHASTAPVAAAQVPVHVVHTASAGIWLAGLAGTIWVLTRAPRLGGPAGQSLAGLVLRRYALVAVAVLAVVVVTGTIRVIGQLDDPAQLWSTAYGRTVLVKLALLAPVVFLGLWSGRIVSALRRLQRRPPRAALRLVPPRAALELGLGIAIVAAATLLAGQVPGRI